jgi:hypothetical protein
VVGRNAAVVHWGSFKLKGFIAWLVWGIAHVYLLVGFHNRFLVTMRWLWTYLTFQRGGRLITEDVVRTQPAAVKRDGTEWERAPNPSPTSETRKTVGQPT